MHHQIVNDEKDALVYLTECTLATVESMAVKKSKTVSEYHRQKFIAQSGIDWILRYQCNQVCSRVAEVIHGYDASVENWAKSIEKEFQ